MTEKKFRDFILDYPGEVSFTFKGENGMIILLPDGKRELVHGKTDVKADCIEEVIELPVFDGRSFVEIRNELSMLERI